MNKKLVLFIVCFVCLVGAYFLVPKRVNTLKSIPCPFCKTSVLESQKFYEDELILVLYTHKPIMPGHCLIIPKRHVERFENLSDAEAIRICRTICKVDQAVSNVFGTSTYLLLEKNGHEAGQTVPHVHFHYIPRKTGDDSVLKFIAKMFFANSKKPIAPLEMERITALMKAEMNGVLETR